MTRRRKEKKRLRTRNKKPQSRWVLSFPSLSLEFHHFQEFEKNWEDSRQGRVDSWLSFKGIEKPPEKKVKGAPAHAPAPSATQGGGKEKKEKKKKMNKFSPIGFRPPKTKPESR